MSSKQVSKENRQFRYMVRELHKLAVARFDIVEAQAACQYIIDNIADLGDPLYYPHSVTLVICYARPFARNNVCGALGNKWSAFPNEPATGMHKRLVDARNTFVAHSDGGIRRLQITPKGYSVPGTQYVVGEYTCLVRKCYIALENLPLAKANCQYLVSRMNDEIRGLLDYVAPQLDLSNGPLEIDVAKL